MNLTDKEKYYLEMYKDVNDINYANMKPMDAAKIRQLNYKNINMLLNFINNPDSINIQNIIYYDIDEMIEMIKSLINIACKCASTYDLPYECLYRYENNANIRNYDEDKIVGFKSASSSRGEVEIFKERNNTLLEYRIDGFCPFIPIDKIINGKELSDEHEVIFPPYLNCIRNGNNVEIKYDEQDINEHDLMFEEMHYMFEIKDEFSKVFWQDWRNNKVSDELRKFCRDINKYLSLYAKYNYMKYKELYDYNEENTKGRSK